MLRQADPLLARALDDARSDSPARAPEGGSAPRDSQPQGRSQGMRNRDRCRTRMISFRVSEREFEQLRVRSEADGARNISEYARTALCEGPKPSDADIRRLSSEIQRIGHDVARVTELIEHGSARGGNPATED